MGKEAEYDQDVPASRRGKIGIQRRDRQRSRGRSPAAPLLRQWGRRVEGEEGVSRSVMPRRRWSRRKRRGRCERDGEDQQARVREGGRQRGEALLRSATKVAENVGKELDQVSAVAI